MISYLFDQRGTLYSEPNLICSESREFIPESLTLEADELAQRSLEVMRACHDRLVAAGVNLGAYNSLENAADVDDVRRALGYDQINFYGVSYGTLLGLHLMRDYPEHLRSVILDGVVPPQTNFIPNIFQNQQRVFDEFFASCDASVACSVEYPHLQTRFFELVSALNAEPAELTLTHPDTGKRFAALLSGDDLIDLTFQLFYISGSVGALPKVIADAEQNDFTFLQGIYAILIFDDTFSEGMYNSVICAEDADFSPSNIDLDGLRPEFSENAPETLQEYLDICAVWQVPELDPSVDDPVASDIPTLLLSGRFDPITPPQFADIVAPALTNVTNVTLPTGGHGVGFLIDNCIDNIVDEFLTSPQSKPNTACLSEVEEFEYALPGAVPIPFLGQLNSLGENAIRHLVASALFLMTVLSAMVLWPLGFIWRQLRDRPRIMDAQATRVTRRGRWLVFWFCFVALLFTITLGTIIWTVTLSNPSMMMLAAVPNWALPLFILPLILAMLALLIGISAIRMWLVAAGPLRSRIYYLLITLCAIGYVIVLGLDGMLSILL